MTSEEDMKAMEAALANTPKCVTLVTHSVRYGFVRIFLIQCTNHRLCGDAVAADIEISALSVFIYLKKVI
jgi:hypothetical protein